MLAQVICPNLDHMSLVSHPPNLWWLVLETNRSTAKCFDGKEVGFCAAFAVNFGKICKTSFRRSKRKPQGP